VAWIGQDCIGARTVDVEQLPLPVIAKSAEFVPPIEMALME
jgi:hypothetical protein